ncbi:hypothetical protein BJX76DRAFT_359276 [Aspergillus varians]
MTSERDSLSPSPSTLQPHEPMAHSLILRPSSSISDSTSTTSEAKPQSQGRSPSPSDIGLDMEIHFPDLPVPNEPGMIKELQKICGDIEPIEPILEKLKRGMVVGDMMNVLMEAEAALGRGDVEAGEERTKKGLEMAVELDDREYIDRCRYFMDWVGEIKASPGGRGQGDADAEDEGEDTEKEEGVSKGNEVRRLADEEGFDGLAEAEGESRLSSPNTGSGEVLGDFLAGEGMDEDNDWQFHFDTTSENGSEVGNEGYNADESDNQDDEAGDQGNQKGDDQDGENEDNQENENDFDPRNRPQTPVPPHLPVFDDEEEEEEDTPRPKQAKGNSIQRYDPWQAYADLQQDSTRFSPDYSSDSGNEEEDHLDDLYVSSSDSSDSDTETTITATISRKRKRSAIASTNLTYTFLRRTKPKPLISPNFPLKPKKISPHLKSWLRPEETADIDDEFPSLFWNAHSTTMLMQESIPNGDMKWLSQYESSLFFPRRANFTFRKAMPMRYMASRMRKTDIFPEQEWEFIPKQKDWEAFCGGVGAEKITMGFLEWERERMQFLVREKKAKWAGWLFVHLDSEVAMPLVWIGGLALVLFLYMVW